jgi:Abortive infection C-terminus
MMDRDIIRLTKILKYHKRIDLAYMLISSRTVLIESSDFGSLWNSYFCTFEIHSPIGENDKLTSLSKQDKDEIFKALVLIYPVKEGHPEITQIEYYPDLELEEEAGLVETEGLERIDFNYIQDQIKKCVAKISEKDFDGAVTNSRTLLESICLYIYEKKEGVYNYKGNLIKLYKDVSKILNMTPSDYSDEYLKQILSGVFSIVNGVSGLRNKYSDAHGSSPKKTYKIDARHAVLTVNLSKTIAEYLFLSYEKSEEPSNA